MRQNEENLQTGEGEDVYAPNMFTRVTILGDWWQSNAKRKQLRFLITNNNRIIRSWPKTIFVVSIPGSTALASFKKGKHGLVFDKNVEKLHAIRGNLEDFAFNEKPESSD